MNLLMAFMTVESLEHYELGGLAFSQLSACVDNVFFLWL